MSANEVVFPVHFCEFRWRLAAQESQLEDGIGDRLDSRSDEIGLEFGIICTQSTADDLLDNSPMKIDTWPELTMPSWFA